MRRTRRRAKYTWFPMSFIDAADPPRQEAIVTGNAINIQFGIGDPEQIVVITPVTIDAPMDPSSSGLANTGDLVRQIGQDYVIERIVGKVFVASSAIRTVEGPPFAYSAVEVGCGFFVARVNDEQSGGGINTPIGSATAVERISNYSPLHPDTIREPWMWRRTWLLGNAARTALFTGQGMSIAQGGQEVWGSNAWFPPSNAGYGSVLDGPHCDIKSVRRVRNDERLFFVVAAHMGPDLFGDRRNRGSDTDFDQVIGPNIYVQTDLRLLGALRRARNSSTF